VDPAGRQIDLHLDLDVLFLHNQLVKQDLLEG
jgi:hypothetical protein